MGLMGREALPRGAGLWLPDSNGIHMMFMRFPIDAVFLGKPGAEDAAVRPVVSVHAGLRAWTGLVRSCAAPTGCWNSRPARSRHPGTAVGDLVRLG